MPFLAIWTGVLDMYDWFYQGLEPLRDHQNVAILTIVALWVVLALTRNSGYYLRWFLLIVIGAVQLLYFLTFQDDAFWMFTFSEAGFWVWALSYIVLVYFGLKQVVYYFDLLDDGKYRTQTRYSFKRGLLGWAFLVFFGAFALWAWEWLMNVVVVVFVLSQLWQWIDVMKEHKGVLRPSVNFLFYFFGALSTAVVGSYLLVGLVVAAFWILATLLGLVIVFLIGLGAFAIVRRRRTVSGLDEVTTDNEEDVR